MSATTRTRRKKRLVRGTHARIGKNPSDKIISVANKTPLCVFLSVVCLSETTYSIVLPVIGADLTRSLHRYAIPVRLAMHARRRFRSAFLRFFQSSQ